MRRAGRAVGAVRATDGPGEPRGSRTVLVAGTGLRVGPQPITFRADDRAGNVTTVRRTVIVDNHPPSVSFGAGS